MENYLLKIIEEGKEQAWIGAKMPFSLVCVDILTSNNFRVSNSLHHNFNVVWFYESLFNETGKYSWKIILDEMIRLLKEDGRLIIRMYDSSNPSLFMVKSFLGRHIGLECKIEYEYFDKSKNIYTTVYSIHRKDFENYILDKWSFVVLTLGDRVEWVKKLLRSVRNNEKKDQSEIIIVGPKNDEYSEFNVRYADWKLFSDSKYPEICKKKNIAIEMAKNPNIMIIHDRYYLDNNFFKGFEDYGYDFDFLTVKQYTEDGNEYPSYAATKKRLMFGTQVMLNNYQKLYDTTYLNGGLIIAKTHTIRKIPFNNLLFWSQMEDVELAEVFMENSIIPRINYISKAYSSTLKEGYLDSWLIDNDNDLEKELERRQFEDINIPVKLSFYRRISKHIPNRLKNTHLYFFIKRYLLHR